jgi:hypothetical protein
MKKCDCKNRKPHPTLEAEVCKNCGRNHYRLNAEPGHYDFSGKDLGCRVLRDKWSDN